MNYQSGICMDLRCHRRQQAFIYYALIAFVVGIVLGGCSHSETKWKETQEQYTIEAYISYMKELPDSPHVNEAKARIEELEWEAAFKAKDEQLIRVLLKKYPSDKNRIRAEEVLWSIKWPTVRQS
ncbi:MAG TPA: hypothetical protein PLK90_02995 [Clostridiales bacterium]|nr:hypothetical protein [Clostridiales bacterium]HQP69346.1 hypothetical protein [Clostridiales bacterium]